LTTIKITKGGETLSLQAPQELAQASDEQVLSYVNESAKFDPPLDGNEFQVERTAEGISVHPAPQYG
jgi:hypothetical protein